MSDLCVPCRYAEITLMPGGLWFSGLKYSRRSEKADDKIREQRRILKATLKRKVRLRRARLNGKHTADQFGLLVEEFEGRCVRCWKFSRELQGDHIVPLYQGGSDLIDNIQPLCAQCNYSKGPESFNWKEYRRKASSGVPSPESTDTIR